MAVSRIKLKTRTLTRETTTNGSGLVNLNDLVSLPEGAKRIVVNSLTSAVICAGIVKWSNGSVYAVIKPYNSATPLADTQVTLQISYDV